MQVDAAACCNTCETLCYNIVNTLFQTLFDIYDSSDNVIVVVCTVDTYHVWSC